MFDLVLLREIEIPPEEKVPSGILFSRRSGNPFYRTLPSGEEGEKELKFIDNVGARYQYLAEEGQTDSFCLYDDIKYLHPRKFEIEIESLLGHLESIANSPVLDLKRDEFKLPVSRVKRFTTRSLAYLSGHSEDWMNRTFTGVCPQKLFAVVQDELWDTYENRFLFTLCKELDYYLLSRIGSINLVSDHFEEISTYYSERSFYYEPVGALLDKNIGSYFKSGSWEKDRDILEATRAFLLQTQKRVRALWQTTLFARLGRSAPIDLGTVHSTNLLQNHQHYRHLMTIRTLLLKNNKSKSPTQEEFTNKLLYLKENIVSYLKKMIQTILGSMHYEFNSAEGRFFSPHGNNIIFIEGESGTIELQNSLSENSLRFVVATGGPVERYKELKSDYSGTTVLVYPTEHVNFDESKAFFPSKGLICALGLSPLSIYSEEVVAKVIFRWMVIPCYIRYPLRVDRTPEQISNFLSAHYNNLYSFDGNSLKCNDSLPVTIDDLKSQLKKYCMEQRLRVHTISDETWTLLEEGAKLAAEVRSCPCCGIKSRQIEFGDNFFSGTCAGCKAQWSRDTNGVTRWKIYSTSQSTLHQGRYASFHPAEN